MNKINNYLAFKIGKIDYCIKLDYVIELFYNMNIFKLVGKNGLKYIANFNGSIYAIYDIFNLKEFKNVILLEFKELKFGLAVQKIRNIIEIETNNITNNKAIYNNEKYIVIGIEEILQKI